MNASTQSGNDLWQTHTIALGGFPAPKFYRLNTSTNTVTQSGFYFASATSDDFNASIAANDAGNCFVTWTSTDTSRQAQVRLSGKLSADAGIAAGPSAFTSPTFYHPSADNPERWGDYSAVTTDPLDAARAWLVNEKVNAVVSSGEAVSYDSDSKQTIPGPVGHLAEYRRGRRIGGLSFSYYNFTFRLLSIFAHFVFGTVIFAATVPISSNPIACSTVRGESQHHGSGLPLVVCSSVPREIAARN